MIKNTINLISKLTSIPNENDRVGDLKQKYEAILINVAQCWKKDYPFYISPSGAGHKRSHKEVAAEYQFDLSLDQALTLLWAYVRFNSTANSIRGNEDDYLILESYLRKLLIEKWEKNSPIRKIWKEWYQTPRGRRDIFLITALLMSMSLIFQFFYIPDKYHEAYQKELSLDSSIYSISQVSETNLQEDFNNKKDTYSTGISNQSALGYLKELGYYKYYGGGNLIDSNGIPNLAKIASKIASLSRDTIIRMYSLNLTESGELDTCKISIRLYKDPRAGMKCEILKKSR